MDVKAQEGRLLHVAKYGRVEEIQALLSKGVDINTKGDALNTPLFFAVTYEYVDAVRVLIQGGADVNIPGQGDKLPLVAAYYKDSLPIFKMLLASGADRSSLGRGAYNLYDDRLDFMEANLLFGGDVNSVDYDGSVALMYATNRGDVEAVHLLLRHQACTHMSSDDGFTPLRDAAEERHSAVVEQLLLHDANKPVCCI